MKRCSGCGEVKPLEAFHKLHKAKDGRTARCGKCRSAAQTARYRQNPTVTLDRQQAARYGVTVDHVEALKAAQGGKCAICGTDEPGGRGRWHVDHDHESGAVRGLLCHHCNLGLGHFRDDVDALRAAIRYLEEAQREHTSARRDGRNLAS
ncbi:HNH endonuclease [Arthrobacter phage Crewmate]|uniref:HNH endonuclease n=1 Tax=Arthrobacter phage Crewmate TaxID=2832317 RepID=A0AA48Y3K7_9CAUD|nr:endonuclease VII [Arthrobacter phage Crewmate]UIW13254.1 HNH endonuclease [Arthrobacter phage Crewmate]